MPHPYREMLTTREAWERSQPGKRAGQTSPAGGRKGSVPNGKPRSDASGWHRQQELEIGVRLP